MRAGRSGRPPPRPSRRARAARRRSCRTLRARLAVSTTAVSTARRSARSTRPADRGQTASPSVTQASAARLIAELGTQLDPELLVLALTHRSFAHEAGGIPTNERLEFLGDTVLGLVVTEALYRRHRPCRGAAAHDAPLGALALAPGRERVAQDPVLVPAAGGQLALAQQHV